MRISLKGINRVRKTLADGSIRCYYYAWKGGPALPGKPGDTGFIEAFNAAIKAKRERPDGEFLEVLAAYQESQKFIDLAPRTQRDYIQHIRKIELEYSDFPTAGLAERQARGEFLKWRDKLAKSSRRQADYTYSVLALIISWAYDRGLVPANPCLSPGKVYRSERIDKIWDIEAEEAFMASAPAHVGLAFSFAIWTGQRQGDLLRLPWSAYDGQSIRLVQQKTGSRVEIPLGQPLRALLSEAPKTTPTILSTTRKTSWTGSGFRSSWRKACMKAGVDGLTFHDLRGTAVTRLAVAGSSVPEIASITGHRLSQVTAILDAHYLSRDPALGKSAISKLEEYQKVIKSPN